MACAGNTLSLIHISGFDIEVYDAATLKYEKTWDLNNDVTYAGIVVIP